MSVQRRVQLSVICFTIAAIATVGLLAAAARDATPGARLNWMIVAVVTFSAGVFLRAWSHRPQEVKPPVPLSKLLPPRRVKDRSGLERDVRR